jgi:hypothetical protein
VNADFPRTVQAPTTEDATIAPLYPIHFNNLLKISSHLCPGVEIDTLLEVPD